MNEISPRKSICDSNVKVKVERSINSINFNPFKALHGFAIYFQIGTMTSSFDSWILNSYQSVAKNMKSF